MLKLLNPPPAVTTLLMFMVLCTMLGMNASTGSSVPPYNEIDSCLLGSIQRQEEENRALLQEIAVDPQIRDTMEARLQSRAVRVATHRAVAAMQYLQQKVKACDTCNVTDSVFKIMAGWHKAALRQINPASREGMSKMIYTGEQYGKIDAARYKAIPYRNKLAILYALQNNILLSEWHILWRIYIDFMPGCSWGMNGFEAIAITGKPLYYTGEGATARIMLATYNPAANPIVVPQKGRIKTVQNGVATWVANANVLGRQVVKGRASMILGWRNKPDTVLRHWSFEYMVLAPGAALSIDKMHILYAGIPTIVTLNAPGYGAAQLSLRIPGAEVKPIAKGQFEVTAGKTQKKLWAYLDAENEEGNTATLTALELKVKPPPLPAVVAEGHDIRFLPVSDLHSPLRLIAHPADYNHDLSTRYTIHSFEYTLLLYDKKTAIGPIRVEGSVVPAIAEAAGHCQLIISAVECSDEYGNSYHPLSTSYSVWQD